jgi:hypothetical protein
MNTINTNDDDTEDIVYDNILTKRLIEDDDQDDDHDSDNTKMTRKSDECNFFYHLYTIP